MDRAILRETFLLIVNLRMSTFERLKQIDPKIKDLVNGYIRMCQNQLFGEMTKQSAYYNIPQLINNHCLLFYETFTWYNKDQHYNLEFISDTEVKVADTHDWSTCMFANEISDKICKKFSAVFEIIEFGECEFGLYFCVGYTTSSSLEESIKDWHEPLGENENTFTSVSWAFCDTFLQHSADAREFQDVSDDMQYAHGDLLKISFNFIDKTAKIYHNDVEKDCRDLTTFKLWIGLSLFYKGTQIKLIEYKYD